MSCAVALLSSRGNNSWLSVRPNLCPCIRHRLRCAAFVAAAPAIANAAAPLRRASGPVSCAVRQHSTARPSSRRLTHSRPLRPRVSGVPQRALLQLQPVRTRRTSTTRATLVLSHVKTRSDRAPRLPRFSRAGPATSLASAPSPAAPARSTRGACVAAAGATRWRCASVTTKKRICSRLCATCAAWRDTSAVRHPRTKYQTPLVSDAVRRTTTALSVPLG
jgi:hypothetical protein